jgi:hypothetical protein
MKAQPGTLSLALLAFTLTLACSDRNPNAPSAATSRSAELQPSGSMAQATPHNSEQVIFSGVASDGSTFPSGTSVGFWIWCEAESTNPYAGECNGAMYFYADRITRHVDDVAIAEISDGIYRITVESTRDSSIACTLTNEGEPVTGPRNTVRVECSAPESGTAVSNNAVVRVTGPGE